jgi:hypothetical protein
MNSVAAAQAHRISAFEGSVVVLTVLVFPVALYAAHKAGHAQILYPAANVLLALCLYARRSPWYAGQCVLLFCFVSLVRRLVDAQAGWNPSSPVLLTPYLCCLLATLGFLRYWLQSNPRYIGVFLCMLLCIAYGVAMAMYQGRTLASLVDALKWSFGPIYAVYLLSEAERHAELRRVIENCLVWASAVMGAYGVVQYVILPVWDAEWMRNVAQLGMDSIGQPEPFAVRVFSTMNSPGSFGIVMMAGIVLGLKRGMFVVALTIPLMLIGLALCQYRSLWAATAVAVAMVVFQRRAALPLANILVLVAMGVVALGTIASVPRIREAIVHRAHTLTKLKSDESLKSRLAQYSDLARNDNLVAGEGLALNGASRRLDKGKVAAIDGALIEIWRGMGVFVGTTFLLCIGVLVVSLLFLPPSLGSDIYYDRAIILATFIQLPMGSVHTGEMGFDAWMFIGFGLAALLAYRSREAPAAVPTLAGRLPPRYEVADA